MNMKGFFIILAFEHRHPSCSPSLFLFKETQFYNTINDKCSLMKILRQNNLEEGGGDEASKSIPYNLDISFQDCKESLSIST